jgi:hypothetical protein
VEQRDVNANNVQARQFQLVDAENKVRAQMSTGPDGSVMLGFSPDGETVRLSLGVNPRGTAAFDLRDGTGGIRARLAVETSGVPTVFSIRDGTNRIRAQIVLQEDETVGMVLSNRWGDERAFIEVHPDEVALFGLNDRDGNLANGMSNEQAL